MRTCFTNIARSESDSSVNRNIGSLVATMLSRISESCSGFDSLPVEAWNVFRQSLIGPNGEIVGGQC